MRKRSKFLLAVAGGGGTDSTVVGSKTTVSGIEFGYDEYAIRSRTSILSGETYVAGPQPDDTVIKSITTIQSLETGYEDDVIGSTTTLIGSSLTESFTIATRDYDFNPWDIPFFFDGTFPVSGCVGMLDDDLGDISLAPLAD